MFRHGDYIKERIVQELDVYGRHSSSKLRRMHVALLQQGCDEAAEYVLVEYCGAGTDRFYDEEMRLLKRHDDDTVSLTEDFLEADLPRYKYAILSHTWGSAREEVKLEDIRDDTAHGKVGWEKIQFCVQRTKDDGIDFFWVDTCCIDQRNPIEVLTALNSMYRWYNKAEKCYVLLGESIGVRERNATWEHAFSHVRWFTRGWTLQELIAPSVVEFYDASSQLLGTKTELAALIHEITTIPIRMLENRAVLSDFDILERKRWRHGRITTKHEDMVYCVIGLLEVHCSWIYGWPIEETERLLDREIAIKLRGALEDRFCLVFSLESAPATVEHFVAREDEISEMRRHLDKDAGRAVVTLHGLGGMGKTQLAMRYVTSHRHRYSAVLWLDCKDEITIRSSFRSIAKRILAEHPDARGLGGLDVLQDIDSLIDAVKSWLSLAFNSRWLMVCDGCDNSDVEQDSTTLRTRLHRVVPAAHQGCIIITTRSNEIGLGHPIKLGKFKDLEDSLKLLEYSSGMTSLTKDPSAVEVAMKLDGLPLALAYAGAYVSQAPGRFRSYLNYYDDNWRRLHKDVPTLPTYNHTLDAAWESTYQYVKQWHGPSARMLHLWAYFDPRDVWYELLHHISDTSPEWFGDLVGRKLDFERHMRVLCDCGFIELDHDVDGQTNTVGYSMHPCVHAWSSSVLFARDREDLERVALQCIAFQSLEACDRHDEALESRLLKHVDMCLSCIEWQIACHPGLGWVFHALGVLYRRRGRLEKAKEMLTEAVGLYSAGFERHNIQHSSAIYELAEMAWQRGDKDEARRVWWQTLEGQERELGEDHPMTLHTVVLLAYMYRTQDGEEQAKNLYYRAMHRYQALGSKSRAKVDALGVELFEQSEASAESPTSVDGDGLVGLQQQAYRAELGHLEQEQTPPLHRPSIFRLLKSPLEALVTAGKSPGTNG